MKFGKLLSRRAIQAEPYKSAYVNYKHLKHVIKDEKKKDAVQVGDPQDKTKVPGHAAFFFALAAEAKKVDALYHSQLDRFRAELAPLVTQINALRDAGQPVPPEVFVAFTSLCKRLDELRAFIVMNYLAFMKILKKFDKKLQQNVKEGVFEFIQERPFYCSHELAELLTQTEVVMNMLSGRSRREDYNCPVCLNILSNPVVLSCAHRFCWHCLAKASLFKQCCPVCRKQQTLDPRHYHVDSALQTFLQEHFPQGPPSAPSAPSGPGPAPSAASPALSEASVLSSPSTAAPMAVDAAPTPQTAASEAQAPPHTPSPPAAALALPPSHAQDAASTPMPITPDHPEEPAPQEGLESRLQSMTVKEQEVMMDLDVMPNTVIQISAFARLLRHKEPSNIVILDLDETVVMTPTTSVLFSHEGIKAFEAYIHNLPTDTATKVQHCQSLQRILDDKVACEADTVSVIRQLQQSGVWVMACTARYANMAPRTQQTLSSLGIDLNVNAPFPPNRALQDPETEAVYANGVIFTNAVDKGEVLNSFLENVVFRGVRKERAPDGTVRWSKPLPHEIVFVDDRYSNSESVLRGLHVAQKLSVPIISYHYVGATMRAPRLDLAPNSRHSRLLRTQIAKFIESGVVLTDEQCEKLIR